MVWLHRSGAEPRVWGRSARGYCSRDTSCQKRLARWGRAKGGPMKCKRRGTTLVLMALVVLLALTAVGCPESDTTTPGSMMGSPSSSGMMYGTTSGAMMGSSTTVPMMGGQTTAP